MVDLQINTKYCYTCLKLDNGRSTYTRMDFSIPGDISFTKKLKFCIPEMMLENIDYCLMCKQCSIALDSAYLFRAMCLETEIKLQSFRQRKGINAENCLEPDDSYLDIGVVDVGSLSSGIESGDITASSEATTAILESTGTSHPKSLTDEELIEKCCSTIPELKTLGPQSLQCWVASEKIIPIQRKKNDSNILKGLKDTFWCSICDRYIRGKHHYQFHIRRHLNLTYTCRSCSVDCKNQKNFNLHKKLCLKEKERVKEISKKPKLKEIKQNNDVKVVNKHKIVTVKANNRIKRGIFNCKLCSFVTKDKSLVRRHREEHIGTPPYQCNYCSKIFQDSIKFIRHIKEVKHVRPGKKKITKVSVPIKKKETKGKVPIKKIVKKPVKRTGLDIGSPPFECTECMKVFHEASKFLRHIREAKHTRELNLKNVPVVAVEVKKEKHICDICEMDFVSEFELADHRERLHQPIENGNFSNGIVEDIPSKMIEPSNEYYCNICSTRFKRLEFFFNHTCTVESQDPAYSCHLCNAPFVGRISLIEHMEVHFTQTESQNDSITG